MKTGVDLGYDSVPRTGSMSPFGEGVPAMISGVVVLGDVWPGILPVAE